MGREGKVQSTKQKTGACTPLEGVQALVFFSILAKL